MQLECHACGKRFRSMITEARHRHNFPVLCARNKRFAAFVAEHHQPKENPHVHGRDSTSER